jgi:glycosyltransferase involved in cell wall biosynthesis
MKIGFFCNEYPPRRHGGIGTFVHLLSQEFIHNGHQVSVVQFGKQQSESYEAGRRLVTLPECRQRGVAWLINRIRLWKWIRNEARSDRLDVFEIPDYAGYLPIPIANTAIAVRLHMSDSIIKGAMGLPRGKLYWLEKLTLHWHKNWIGVSQFILKETCIAFKTNPLNKTIIYNPAPLIDENDLPNLPQPPSMYVVYVGTVSERKGVLQLAKAMRSVLSTHPLVHLVYVGRETLYEGAPISFAIRNIIGEFESRVRFVGQVPNDEALAWTLGASVLVSVSLIESFGLVLTEAMCLGTPVICSAFGPGSEIIVNGESGYLVNPASITELSDAMLTLLKNRALAKQFSDAGKMRIVEKFQLKNCAIQTLNFYQRILAVRKLRV